MDDMVMLGWSFITIYAKDDSRYPESHPTFVFHLTFLRKSEDGIKEYLVSGLRCESDQSLASIIRKGAAEASLHPDFAGQKVEFFPKIPD